MRLIPPNAAKQDLINSVDGSVPAQRQEVLICSTRMSCLINMEQSDPVVALNSFVYFPILKMLTIISALLRADAMATMTDDYQNLGLIKCLAERLRA